MDQPKVCTMCGAQFDSDEALNKHNAEAHGMDDDMNAPVDEMDNNAMPSEGEPEPQSESTNVCETCGMSFGSKEDKDKHVQEIHGGM
jgi:uncharacterized C2H2 Zn-finger protein